MRDYVDSDYLEVSKWFEKHKILAPNKLDLPKNGKIIEYVAAGFLISTDTQSAIIDFFITNPDAKMRDRSRAIDSIVLGLIQKSRHLGFKRIICDSKIRSIQRRAQALGFHDLGKYQVFCKEA